MSVSLGPRPKTNSSTDRFSITRGYTGSDIRARSGLGMRLARCLVIARNPGFDSWRLLASYPGFFNEQPGTRLGDCQLFPFLYFVAHNIKRVYKL